jgi:hypothetical protein
MSRTTQNLHHFTCHVLVDRVLFVADLVGGKPPRLSGFQIKANHFQSSQTGIRGYGRIQKCQNRKTLTTVAFQYANHCSWLSPLKGSVIAQLELTRVELEGIFAACKNPRILSVEIAFDFPMNSEVDRTFVLAHSKFGKSQPVVGIEYDTVYFGGRKHRKLIRTYAKSEIGRYRIELELHSAWLRQNGIAQPKDLCRLPIQSLQSLINFVELDLDRIRMALVKRQAVNTEEIIRQVRKRGAVLHRALRYLRTQVGLSNVHRFLRPLDEVNEEVEAAFCKWQQRWRCLGA